MSRPDNSFLTRLAPLLAAAAAVALAGCGGGAGTPTSGSDAGTTAPALTVGAAYPVTFSLAVSDRAPGWRQPLTAVGRVTGLAGKPAALLQFRAAASARTSRPWRTLDRASLDRTGHYRFRFRPPSSGAVRLALAPSPNADLPAQAGRAQRLDVHAAISFDTLRLTYKTGQPVLLAGRVEPLRAGRTVVAQAYTGGRWQPVTSTKTAPGGAYRLSWQPHDDLSVRVVADGDRRATPVVQPVGYVESKTTDGETLTPTGPMRTALASRFDDYDLPLACGGVLGRHQQGVAHKTLPCGTLVTITYNGRTVRVPVIDRGPYVAPREFDLTGATADALGFEGVHDIRVSP